MSKKLSTIAIHAGEPKILGAVAIPVFQTANFESANESSYSEIRYARLSNTPNHVALHEKIAALEQAPAALVTGSGMAAISALFFALLSGGDHILIQRTLYGGTFSLLTHDLVRFGVQYDFIDAADPGSWSKALKPNTKMIYVEAISNPLMEVPNLAAVVQFAKSHNLISAIDSTFATPVNFRPVPFGFDVSLHSATKYLNGHSDVVAGCLAGRKDLIERIHHMLSHLGGSLDPHACMLLQRGLKTLVVRVEHQNKSAAEIARFLSQHKRVQQVNYPGLESSPSYARAKEYFSGFGGMLSFELAGGADAVERFLSKARLPIVAASLGGVESLFSQPARTSHALLTPAERAKVGISETLIRMSVGLEDTGDLIQDLDQALS